jgi:hypothetical protein
MPRLDTFVAPADANGQQAVRAASYQVNYRSPLTFSATAELNASMCKKSIPSAMVFSMIIRWAYRSTKRAAVWVIHI